MRIPIICVPGLLLWAAAAGLANGQHIKPPARNYTIVSRPRYHRVRRPDIELANADDGGGGGLVAEEHFTYLDFKLRGKTYSVFWRSIQSGGPPVYLADNLTYEFRLRVSGNKAKLIDIRRGGRLIWKNAKLKR